jgi:hypothetical protein
MVIQQNFKRHFGVCDQFTTPPHPIYQILLSYKFSVIHPYKMAIVQELWDGEKQYRKIICSSACVSGVAAGC